MRISGSLLAADLARLGHELRRCQRACIDSIHIDVMDGHYAPNMAFSPSHLAALQPHCSLPFHVHLELDNPAFVLGEFRPWQADCIIVCRDTLQDAQRVFDLIRARGARVGLSFNAADDMTASRALLPHIDMLLVLAVNAGFGGQPMQPGTPERVQQARRLRNEMGLGFEIAVDGGVNGGNAAALAAAGADVLVVGTALFAPRNMKQAARKLLAACA